MKNIKKGEELAFDYSINVLDGEDWKMKCHCKSKNCRINLNGEFFSLPNKLQKNTCLILTSGLERDTTIE